MGVGPRTGFKGVLGPLPSDFKNQRERMVIDQLLDRCIRDPNVLAAFAKLPRHLFVSEEHRSKSYMDHPLPIGFNQTISQPYITALMTQELSLKPGGKVLEVGTGSGYQTAVLAFLGAKVYSIERIPELAEAAAKRLKDLGYSEVEIRVGDGSRGWPEKAPFDGILVTAAAAAIPAALTAQLADSGRLVAPVGESTQQILTAVERVGRHFRTRPLCPCLFVPLVST